MAPSQATSEYDVVIVGAGISGINFGYRLQERNPSLSYIILESRHELGGTWSLFQYPGIRSDSDLFTFGFPWRPWKEESPIANGGPLIEYLRESAEMYGIDKKMHFNHRVRSAEWSTSSKKWTFDVDVASGAQTKTIRSQFFMMCTGYYDYDRPLDTIIPGIDTFQGRVIHPQFWPADLDYTDKDVVIIGSGATAITILPAMTDRAKHVTMLQRSPSYILSMPKEDGLERFIRRWSPRWVVHTLIRWKWIAMPFMFITFCKWFPAQARKIFKAATVPQLPDGVSYERDFTPKYDPWDQRVCFCPSGDFYQALRKGIGSVKTGVIENVTAKTIKLQSGEELHPDIIVTATGLRLRVGGGIDVRVDGKPFDVSEKFVWKGVMLQDLPNCAFVIGYVDASWTLGADATAQMVCRILKQMTRTHTVEVVPRLSDGEKKTLNQTRFLNLTSTYIEKGGNVLPKTGDKGQWRPRRYYFQDLAMAWYGDIRTNLEWIRGV